MPSRTVSFARDLRRNMTDAERKLWRELRLRQMQHKFRRQHPIGTFIVDFACIEARLCIEVDGDQHADNVARDEGRSAVVRAHGYRVLRFSNRQVLMEIESVKQVIWSALHTTNTTPPP